jgi:UDP-3-O-[3-hydroxymyristoyl] glucosamine N-acyltransferase
MALSDQVSMSAVGNAGHDAVIGDSSQISSQCDINGNGTLGEDIFS